MQEQIDFHARFNLPMPPSQWRVLDVNEAGVWYTDGFWSVIISAHAEADGHTWAHVSCAGSATLPSYKTMCMVKSTFLGEDRKAVMVFAPKHEHVNIHPNCLHLYSCLTGDALPDFRKDGVI